MIRKISIQLLTVVTVILMLASSVVASEVGITPTALPSIANTTNPYPLEINDNGLILGRAYSSSSNQNTFVLWNQDQIIEIGSYPGATYTNAVHLNNNGQVIGTAGNSSIGWIWEDGTFTALGKLNANDMYTIPQYLSDNGMIAGISYDTSYKTTSWVWEDGQFTILAPLAGYNNNQVREMNNHGQVIGFSYNQNTSTYKPWIWEDGQYTDLVGLPNATYSYPQFMNDRGDVVGVSNVSNTSKYWIWSNGQVTEIIGLAGKVNTSIQGLNENGQILGTSYDSNYNLRQSWIMKDGVYTEIAKYNGLTNSNVSTLNDLGQVVGSSYDSNYATTTWVWTNGEFTKLENLPGSSYTYARTAYDMMMMNGYTKVMNNSQVLGQAQNAAVVWSLGPVAPSDTLAPTATIAYSTTDLTNQDVIATITPSEEVTITNNNGLNTYTFTDNGSVIFTFTDLAGNTGTAIATVSNIDKVAPTATVMLSADIIKQSNHKMHTITADVVNADDQAGVNTVVLTSITSNEADNGLGDGDTADDIQNASYGTHDLSFDLRGERSGKGTGRVYTITYTITDQAGNVTTASATVTVPKGSGK